MNSETKIAAKLELIRDLLEHTNSTTDQSTVLWMRECVTECFESVVGNVSVKNFKKAIDNIKSTLTPFLPSKITGVFMISVITHIIEDINGTKYYLKLEPLLDACYNLDSSEKDSIECREQAGLFVNKLCQIVD